MKKQVRHVDCDISDDSSVRSLEQEEEITWGNMGEGKKVEDEVKLYRTCHEKRMEKAVKYVRRKMQELLTMWRTKIRFGERQKASLELKLTGNFYMKTSQRDLLTITKN